MKNIRRRKSHKLHLDFAEYSPQGLHYTSESWRRALDPDRQLLTFACLFRVFTREQAVRYLCQGNLSRPGEVRRANDLLDRHTGQQQWFCSINYQFSEAPGGTFEVYYLTQHAVVVLRKIAPVLARYASPGKPVSVDYERVPHDVDVVEAFLFLLRTLDIHEFINEKELKRRLSRVFNERREQGRSEAVRYTTGDFMVLLSKRGDDEKWSNFCEVATENMKAGQVKTKPDRMIWFTRNLHRRDVIAEIKGSKTPIYILDDPIPCHMRLLKMLVNMARESAPGVPRSQATSAETLNLKPREKRVLHALEQFGGAATTEAIAAFLGVKRAGISTCMNQLTRKKVLRSEGACLCAEHDLGTPTLLYMRWEQRLATENLRRHRLIVSLMFVEFTLHGFRFCSYDAATGALEVRHTTELVLPHQVIVADNHEIDLATLRQRIMRARGGIRDGKQLIVAMTDRSRMRKLREAEAQIKIVDVSREARYEIETRDEAA